MKMERIKWVKWSQKTAKSREYFTNEFLKHIQTTDSIMSTRGYKELCQEVLDTRTEIDHLIDDNTKFQEMAINKMTELRAENARLTAELAELRERATAPARKNPSVGVYYRDGKPCKRKPKKESAE